MLRFFLLAVLLLQSAQHTSADFHEIEFEGARFLVNKVDLKETPLRLFLTDAAGKTHNRFENLERYLNKQGLQLRWAMNAGMYHGDFRPVGLCIIEGKELSPLNLAEDEGNFFLKPNGVFAVEEGRPIVLESNAFQRARYRPEYATQSGPMLVINGQIHPKFSPASTSRLIRNGVGVDTQGRAVFVLSSSQINFHSFARLFRDQLGCRNALFLDGTICSLYSKKLKRNDFRMDLGPILGVIDPL